METVFPASPSGQKMPVMKTLRVLFILSFALLSTAAWAQPLAIPVGTRPESVAKGWGDSFFVTIQGTPEPGDGEIAGWTCRAGR